MVSYLLLCWFFTYSYTFHWSLSYSYTPCAGLFHLLLYLTLVSFTPLYIVLVFLPTPIPCIGLFHTPLPFSGLYLTLVPFTLLYLVLVFLPNYKPYVGLFCTPLPYCWSTFSYTVHCFLSYSSTLCWSFYLLLCLTLVSLTLLYLVLVSLPTPIPYTGLFHIPLPGAGLFA